MNIIPDYQRLNDVLDDTNLGKKEVKRGELIIELSKRNQKNPVRIQLPYTLIITENGKIIGDELVGYFNNPTEYLFRTMEVEGLTPKIEKFVEEIQEYDGGSFGGGMYY